MTDLHSVPTQPAWTYPVVPKMRVQGRSTVEDNFAPEKRGPLEIFVREAIQNPLDARDPRHQGPVEVTFRELRSEAFDADYLTGLIDADYVRRLQASSGTVRAAPVPAPSVLVVEDFGTIGLEGSYGNPDLDGTGQNWNAFWFREGEGAKAAAGSNGRAGQGKITYYRTSSVRAIFALTVRASDGTALLMGRSSLRRNYALTEGGEKFERDAFWCRHTGELALPASDPAVLDQFRQAFRLNRQHLSGLSLVIPYPFPFDERQAIRTVITDFYYPVARNRLAVTIGALRIDRSNLNAIAAEYLPDTASRELESSLTSGFRAFLQRTIDAGEPAHVARSGWARSTQLTDANFEEGAPAQLRQALKAGQIVSVRFPLSVRRSGEPAEDTYVDVCLQVPEEELERPEEAYIRTDLLIGSEVQLARARHLPPARGLTYIGHGVLSAFMADAEEPTHMKWNASRPRLSEDYEQPREVVAAVRNAMPRLLAFLAEAAARRDTRALAGLFARPAQEESTRRTTGSQGQGGKGGSPDGPDVPPAVPKPFRWQHGDTWDRVYADGSPEAGAAPVPIEAIIEFAYLGVDDDAFGAYDPFDFDLARIEAHPVMLSGGTLLERARNRVRVTVTERPFSLTVGGFDPNLRRRMRIDYKVPSHAESVIDE